MAGRRSSARSRRYDYGVSPREAASIELARTLQQEANAQTLREYEDHYFALEFAREHNLGVPPPPPVPAGDGTPLPPPAQGSFLRELNAMQAHRDYLVALEYGQEDHLDAAARDAVRRRQLETPPLSPAHGEVMREWLALQAHHDHLFALELDRQQDPDGGVPARANALQVEDHAYYDSEEELGEGIRFHGAQYAHGDDYGFHAPEMAGAAVPLAHVALDPDNMTYEERLELSERVGDVMKERWREISTEVIAALPAHRWTDRSPGGGSCIICQSAYERGEVCVTLPCTHVFHGDCLSGWACDNNSCPLCKKELKSMS